MNTFANSQTPRYNHTDSNTFLGCFERWDIYLRSTPEGPDLVARSSDQQSRFRAVPFAYAVVYAGRGNALWGAAVALSDEYNAPAPGPVVEIAPSPGRVVHVRAHWRSLPCLGGIPLLSAT